MASKFPWSGLLVTALTIVLVWWFVKDLDPGELLTALSSAHPGLLVVAVFTTLQTYVIRAYRWQMLLRPLGDVPFRPAFRTTVIGFTAIFLLPARVGDLLRPYLLAKHQGLSASATFATVVVERVLDLTAVLLLFAVTTPLLGVDVGAQTRMASLGAAVAAVAALVVMTLSAGHPERVGRLMDRCTVWLPTRLGRILGEFTRKFAEGLAVMRDPRAVFRTLAWSLVLWASICLGIWLVSAAFMVPVPLLGTSLIVMYLVVGVAAPTPGGFGAFHVAYQFATTTYFGASLDAAAAAAIVLHLVSFVPVAVLGFVFMWQDGLTLGGLRRMQPEGADRP